MMRIMKGLDFSALRDLRLIHKIFLICSFFGSIGFYVYIWFVLKELIYVSYIIFGYKISINFIFYTSFALACIIQLIFFINYYSFLLHEVRGKFKRKEISYRVFFRSVTKLEDGTNFRAPFERIVRMPIFVTEDSIQVSRVLHSFIDTGQKPTATITVAYSIELDDSEEELIRQALIAGQSPHEYWQARAKDFKNWLANLMNLWTDNLSLKGEVVRSKYAVGTIINVIQKNPKGKTSRNFLLINNTPIHLLMRAFENDPPYDEGYNGQISEAEFWGSNWEKLWQKAIGAPIPLRALRRYLLKFKPTKDEVLVWDSNWFNMGVKIAELFNDVKIEDLENKLGELEHKVVTLYDRLDALQGVQNLALEGSCAISILGMGVRLTGIEIQEGKLDSNE